MGGRSLNPARRDLLADLPPDRPAPRVQGAHGSLEYKASELEYKKWQYEQKKRYQALYETDEERSARLLKSSQAQKRRRDKITDAGLPHSAAYSITTRENRNKRRRENKRVRLSEDTCYRIRHSLSCNLSAALKRQKHRKDLSVVDAIGCSMEQLKDHLESQFVPGMTWDNYGSMWHVDHVLPTSRFDLKLIAQQRACYGWRNLRPLWAVENCRKGDRLEVNISEFYDAR